MKQIVPVLCLLSTAPILNAAISLNGPSTSGWTSLGSNYDFLKDQQTGDPSSDIVGSADNPGFFTSFDNAGTPSLTDGFLGFRIRLDDHGGNSNNIEFDRNLWVGIDADLSGSVDVFLGLNMQGNANELAIFAPGSGANTSPSTTTISNTAAFTYAPSASNFNYRPVNHSTDGGTTSDSTPTTNGDTDYYVSFLVPFANVVSFLNSRNPAISINENTSLRYVLATSTNPNSLNQDLGGVNGGVNSTSTWAALGGFSSTVSITGQVIPECSASLLAFVGAMVGFGFRHRR